MAINGLIGFYDCFKLAEYAPRMRSPSLSPDTFFSYGIRYLPVVRFGSKFAHILYCWFIICSFFPFLNNFSENNIEYLCFFVLFFPTLYISYGFHYFFDVRFNSNFAHIFYDLV